jgi:hypothetical protein
MRKPILAILTILLASSTLSACVVAPAPGPYYAPAPVVVSPVVVPFWGHYGWRR